MHLYKLVSAKKGFNVMKMLMKKIQKLPLPPPDKQLPASLKIWKESAPDKSKSSSGRNLNFLVNFMLKNDNLPVWALI